MLRGGMMVLILSFMWPFGSKDWRDAEKAWRVGMQAERNPQKKAQRYEPLPYAFLTRTGTDNIYRIVHNGRLLPRGGGVDALGAYLRDIDVFHRDKVDAGDFSELLKTFEAKPPTNLEMASFVPSLQRELRRTPDRIEFVVHCIVPLYEERPGLTRTRPGAPDDREVERWTLTIDRQHAAWTKEMITVKTSSL